MLVIDETTGTILDYRKFKNNFFLVFHSWAFIILKTSRKFYLNIFTCADKKWKILFVVFSTNSNSHVLGYWRPGVKDHRLALQKWPLVLFCKKGILKNVANFTRKHLYWSLSLIKLQACNFIKRRLQHRWFFLAWNLRHF